MPDRSRFFVVPFDPDVPIEEVSSGGVAQKRLEALGQSPLAVGIEYLPTGYKEQVKQEPEAQAVQALMRRILRGLPETVVNAKQLEEWTAKKDAAREAVKKARESESKEDVPGPPSPPRPDRRMDVG